MKEVLFLKLIIGITGATGAIFGIRLLEILKSTDIETHLILSSWAKATIPLETSYTTSQVEALADVSYSSKDQAARISSGSFRTEGMIIAPCSMKTTASIRHGFSDNLIARAADVVLKERKHLLLMTRETPLNTIHLENMLALSKLGVTIAPPLPAFYNHPADINELVDHIAYRTLDQFGIHMEEAERWEGLPSSKHK